MSPCLQIGDACLPESHCAGVVDGDEPLVGGGGQPDHRVRVRLLVPLRVDRLTLRRLGNRDVPAREGNYGKAISECEIFKLKNYSSFDIAEDFCARACTAKLEGNGPITQRAIVLAKPERS